MPRFRIGHLIFYRPFLLTVCLFFSLLSNSPVQAQDPIWDKPFIGSDPNLLYYPDQNAVYVRYGWENTVGVDLVIKGKMPESRYFSFNLYNDYSKSSIGALADFEIQPDPTDSSRYTIYITRSASKGSYRNQLVLPDTVRFASVFLRYYLPRGNALANKFLPDLVWLEEGKEKRPPASRPNPSLSSADFSGLKTLITNQPNLLTRAERKTLADANVPVEQKAPLISKVFTMPIFKHFSDPKHIHAYNFKSDGNYPNKDNHYIVMPVIKHKKNLLIVRFKAPSHGKQLGDQSGDVRYYSLSQGNEYTQTSMTLHDEKLTISQDGFVYVMVGPNEPDIQAKAKALGINFMPWMYQDRIVLILRHMLPNASFRHGAHLVPVFKKELPANGQEAEVVMHEFALTGQYVSPSQFKKASSMNDFHF